MLTFSFFFLGVSLSLFLSKAVVAIHRSLEEAFKDLRGLMAKAAEMVDLAERFRTTMAAQRKAAQQEAEGAQQPDADAQLWMDSEMQAELVNMGIASPVTKAESGARYHQELSRQVPAALVMQCALGKMTDEQGKQLFLIVVLTAW